MEILLPDKDYEKYRLELYEILDVFSTDRSIGNEENMLTSIGSIFYNLFQTIFLLLKELVLVIQRFIKAISKLFLRDKQQIDNCIRIFKKLITNREKISEILSTEVSSSLPYPELQQGLSNSLDLYSVMSKIGNIHEIRSHIAFIKTLSKESTGVDLGDTPYPMTRFKITSNEYNLLARLSAIGLELTSEEYFKDSDILKRAKVVSTDVIRDKYTSGTVESLGYSISNIQDLYTTSIVPVQRNQYDINEIESLVKTSLDTVDKMLKSKTYIVDSGQDTNPRHKVNRIYYLSYNLIIYSNIILCLGSDMQKKVSVFSELLKNIIINNRV